MRLLVDLTLSTVAQRADNWAFRAFEAFWAYLSRSKPGDLYQAWSLPALLARDMAIVNMAFPMASDVEVQPQGTVVTPDVSVVLSVDHG